MVTGNFAKGGGRGSERPVTLAGDKALNVGGGGEDRRRGSLSKRVQTLSSTIAILVILRAGGGKGAQLSRLRKGEKTREKKKGKKGEAPSSIFGISLGHDGGGKPRAPGFRVKKEAKEERKATFQIRCRYGTGGEKKKKGGRPARCSGGKREYRGKEGKKKKEGTSKVDCTGPFPSAYRIRREEKRGGGKKGGGKKERNRTNWVFNVIGQLERKGEKGQTSV